MRNTLNIVRSYHLSSALSYLFKGQQHHTSCQSNITSMVHAKQEPQRVCLQNDCSILTTLYKKAHFKTGSQHKQENSILENVQTFYLFTWYHSICSFNTYLIVFETFIYVMTITHIASFVRDNACNTQLCMCVHVCILV